MKRYSLLTVAKNWKNILPNTSNKPASLNFDATSGEDGFTASVKSSAIVESVESLSVWCQVSTNGASLVNVMVTVDPYTYYVARSPTVILHMKLGENRTSVTVPITQAGVEIPEWVSVAGIKWATRNVDMPGTFAAKPESLANYSSQWTTLNGVNGRVLGNDNDLLFLPAAGNRAMLTGGEGEEEKGEKEKKPRHSTLDSESYGIAGQARNDIRSVEVFDVYGRKVSSHHLTPPTSHLLPQTSSYHQKINISHINSGIYFVMISTEACEDVKKIVKQ